MTQLHDLTMLEQADAVRRREVSPVDLVEHYLERIDRISDDVGAFVTVTPELARAAAKEAERAVTDGEDLPPLHGVPTAIKDLYLTAGVPTSFGTSAFAPIDVGIDEFFVTKLKDAGVISLGKTNTPEFGAPCYTEPDVAPPARTPWDFSRSAGGSSGGAAAAVSSGLVAAAPGSDGGGSIRIPSSVCGLFGIKTSRGRVSNAPLNPDISGLSVHGPIARTVRDAAALLDAMAGPAPGDWIWHEKPESFLAACDDEPRGMRIGRYITPIIAGTEIHPDCVAAYEHASQLLSSLGHTVEDHAAAFTDELVPAFETLWAVEFAALPVSDEDEPKLRPLTRWLRHRGRSIGATQVFGALGTLRGAARAELERTQSYDAILTPTIGQPPDRKSVV